MVCTMKLKLNKSQKVKGLSKKVSYSLTAQVMLTEEERQYLQKYKLANEVVYAKERVTPDMSRDASLIRNLSAIALNLRITVSDLVNGRTIVCKDIGEIMDVEATIVRACQGLKNLLTNCSQFEGEQIIEF